MSMPSTSRVLQPLADEILDECFGAVVFEHSLTCTARFLRNSLTLDQPE